MSNAQDMSRAQPFAGRFGREAWQDFAGVVFPPLLLSAALVALWAVTSGNGTLPSYILPAPQAIVAEFFTNTEVLTRNSLITLGEAMAGFVIGTVLAIVGAVAMTYSRLLRDTFYPYALASRAIPMVVLTPIFVLGIGRGMPAIIGMVSLAVYFPTFLSMMRGMETASEECHELLYTHSATRWQRLVLVQLPASLPYLFAALKVSASITFIATVVGEWVGSNGGLGFYVLVCSQFFKLPAMWAAIVLVAAYTLMLLGAVIAVERLLGRWTRAEAQM